jgi:hypothetical protein
MTGLKSILELSEVYKNILGMVENPKIKDLYKWQKVLLKILIFFFFGKLNKD